MQFKKQNKQYIDSQKTKLKSDLMEYVRKLGVIILGYSVILFFSLEILPRFTDTNIGVANGNYILSEALVCEMSGRSYMRLHPWSCCNCKAEEYGTYRCWTEEEARENSRPPLASEEDCSWELPFNDIYE